MGKAGIVIVWLLLSSQGLWAVTLESKEPERLEVVAALPEFARIAEPRQTVLILRGRISQPRCVEVERLVRAVQQDATKRFLGDLATGFPPVDVCLFESSPEYNAFIASILGQDNRENDLGLFFPKRRLVVGNLSKKLGNLRHEIVHALVNDSFGLLPAWLDEGLASLYGRARRTREGYRFLNDHRLQHVRNARKVGLLPDLGKLASSTEREVYGESDLAYYGLSRYLLLFLDRHGKLKEFLSAFREGSRTSARQLEILEKYVDTPAMLSWIDTL